MESKIVYTHKDLVEKSKSGHRASQYKLYELYVDAMYNSSLRLLGVKEDAEDVVQDSFAEAFRRLDSFRYESTFGSWLKRIVINKSINHAKLKRLPLSPLENHLYTIGEEAEEKPKVLEIEKIKKAIAQLPAGYKQIISLYLIEGYDHGEIAEVLGISTSTSKSQYHRAKKKLIQIVNTL